MELNFKAFTCSGKSATIWRGTDSVQDMYIVCKEKKEPFKFIKKGNVTKRNKQTRERMKYLLDESKERGGDRVVSVTMGQEHRFRRLAVGSVEGTKRRGVEWGRGGGGVGGGGREREREKTP